MRGKVETNNFKDGGVGVVGCLPELKSTEDEDFGHQTDPKAGFSFMEHHYNCLFSLLRRL